MVAHRNWQNDSRDRGSPPRFMQKVQGSQWFERPDAFALLYDGVAATNPNAAFLCPCIMFLIKRQMIILIISCFTWNLARFKLM